MANVEDLLIPAIKAEIKEEVEDSTFVLDHHAADILATDPPSSQLISHNMQMSVHKKHCCKVCGKTFLLKKTLKQHYGIHMVEKHYKCSICSVTFIRNYLLLRHIKTHSQINPSSTSYISASKTVKITCKERTGFSRSSKAVVSYGCPICSEMFPGIPMLNRHAKIHSVEMPFNCRLCINRFSTENDLLVHALEAHGDKEPYGCYFCSKNFGLHALLEKHLQDHGEGIKNGLRDHKCQFCMRCFKGSKSLVSHVRIHLRERPYQCHMCNKTFRKQSNLNEHYIGHSGKKPYKCDFCGFQFTYNSQFRRHIQTHSADATKRNCKCALCCKSFMDEAGLRHHLIIHIKDKRLHKCPHCPRLFRYLFYLQGHLKKEHEHICTVCQLCLTSREELKVHEGEHMRECNKCHVCGVTFMSEFGLTLHMRIHTGEKQLKCKRCKVFRSPMGTKQKPCLECAELNKGTADVPASQMSASFVIETKPNVKRENY